MSELLGVTLETRPVLRPGGEGSMRQRFVPGGSWVVIETLEDDGFVVTARHKLADEPVLVSHRRAEREDLRGLESRRGSLRRLAHRLGLVR